MLFRRTSTRKSSYVFYQLLSNGACRSTQKQLVLDKASLILNRLGMQFFSGVIQKKHCNFKVNTENKTVSEKILKHDYSPTYNINRLATRCDCSWYIWGYVVLLLPSGMYYTLHRIVKNKHNKLLHQSLSRIAPVLDALI